MGTLSLPSCNPCPLHEVFSVRRQKLKADGVTSGYAEGRAKLLPVVVKHFSRRVFPHLVPQDCARETGSGVLSCASAFSRAILRRRTARCGWLRAMRPHLCRPQLKPGELSAEQLGKALLPGYRIIAFVDVVGRPSQRRVRFVT